MEEAERFDWLVAMNDGQILATGTPQELLQRTNTPTVIDAIALCRRSDCPEGHHDIEIPKREFGDDAEIAIRRKTSLFASAISRQ